MGSINCCHAQETTEYEMNTEYKCEPDNFYVKKKLVT
jgi:hypothetical protein